MEIFFLIAVLIMSVVIHEVSHGYTAYLLGDSTAKYAGRLTLNPIKHLDFVGSFLVPLMTYFLGGFVFGWAKPVPYNPYNLKDQKWSPAMVGLAGPASNFLLVLAFGALLRFVGPTGLLPGAFFEIAAFVVLINLVLGCFNLIPIPPLDGSKLLFAILPYQWNDIQRFLEQYGFFFLIFFIMFFWRFALPVIFTLFKLVTGIAF